MNNNKNNSVKTETQLQVLFRLYRYAGEYRGSVIAAVCYSAINKVLDLFPPILIGLSVDTIVKADQSFIGQLGDYDQFQQLVIIALLTVVVWVLESYFEYLFSVKWKYLAQVIQHKLRMNSFDHLLKLDQKFMENQSSGNLISIINDDVNQLERFLDGGINDLIQISVTVLVIGGIYFSKSPYLAVLSFITMPVIIYGGIWFQGYLTPLYKDVRNKVGLLSSELSNSLQGIGTIKSFAREKESYDKLNQLSLEYFDSNKKAINISSMFTPIIRMLVMCGFLMTLLVGGNLTLKGQLEIGTFSVLVFLIQRLLWPLTRLGQTLDLFQRAMASASRIFTLIEAPIELISGTILKQKQDFKGDIEFKNIGFTYAKSNLISAKPDTAENTLNSSVIFKNFNLKIESGKSLGIVGSTGSGKSTLIKLLQRFYDPTSGEILVDGKDIKDFDLKSLRSAISVVSQDVYLFHGTILENLKFSKPEASDFEIFQACETACIHEFIETLPEKYNTIVGERGQRLSGGQKQRLSIARMLLADSPIIVLDEATSAVDNIMEAKLQLNLHKILKSKTTIVIAHRLSTVVGCDRIVVIEHGQIIESGSHNNLIEEKGLYNSLWNVQTGQEFKHLQ